MITVKELREWLCPLPNTTPLGITLTYRPGEIVLHIYAAGMGENSPKEFFIDTIDNEHDY